MIQTLSADQISGYVQQRKDAFDPEGQWYEKDRNGVRVRYSDLGPPVGTFGNTLDDWQPHEVDGLVHILNDMVKKGQLMIANDEDTEVAEEDDDDDDGLCGEIEYEMSDVMTIMDRLLSEKNVDRSAGSIYSKLGGRKGKQLIPIRFIVDDDDEDDGVPSAASESESVGDDPPTRRFTLLHSAKARKAPDLILSKAQHNVFLDTLEDMDKGPYNMVKWQRRFRTLELKL